MRKVEQLMIRTIHDLLGRADFAGTIRCSANTTVEQSHRGIHGTLGYERLISVRLHGNEIATILPIDCIVYVRDCNWRTPTTKSRLNAIIGTFTRHAGISQVRGEWLRIEPNGARYAWPELDCFPLKLDADNYNVCAYIYG